MEIELETPQYQSKIYLQHQFFKLNKSKREIAEENNVALRTIGKWFRRHNIKREKPIYNNEIWLKNQYLILRKSVKKIAIENNANESSIRKYLVLFNISIRPKREATILAMDKRRKNKINNTNNIRIQYRQYKNGVQPKDKDFEFYNVFT